MKKVISSLLALLSVMIFAIPAFAAEPLGYNDFNMSNISTHDIKGLAGYIDRKPEANNFIDCARVSGNPYFTQGRFYTQNDLLESQIDNRGIAVGFSKDSVFKQFGKTNINTLEGDEFARYADPYNLPVSEVTYSYTKTGRGYNKTFYFNDENKVCFIVWWIS